MNQAGNDFVRAVSDWIAEFGGVPSELGLLWYGHQAKGVVFIKPIDQLGVVHRDAQGKGRPVAEIR